MINQDKIFVTSKAAANYSRIMFLAHWVENLNWWLWWFKDLHRYPERMRWLLPLWPLSSMMSLYYLIGPKPYNVVDRFHFNDRIEAETWLLRNFAWHFLRRSWRKTIRERILHAVIEAQDNGIDVIGLGALTKAEWLTSGGKWIVDKLGTRLKKPIVHGDTLTAAAVYKLVRSLIVGSSIEENRVFITGATSKIGRAVALSLVNDGIPVALYTKDIGRYQQILSEVDSCSQHLMEQVQSLKTSPDCMFWITGKAEPGIGRHILERMPKGAIVVNFAVPDPLTPQLLSSRPDIQHYDGGLMGYDPSKTTLQFTMRLVPGLTYACHAGTMVHGAFGWSHHEVGRVEIEQMRIVWEKALEIGFFLPKPTSHLKAVIMNPK